MNKDKTAIKEELLKKATDYFCQRPANFPTGRPYNCCESIILVLSEYLGINSDLIPRIATAIGAGVSLNGLLCGSVSSVALAIGAKYGRTAKEESPEPAWKLMDEYITAFKDKFGHLNCRQLTGLNLKTKEGTKEYFTRVHDFECTERLKFAVDRAIEIL
jgi:C_GCAxxG_C_C family probable redox protein